MPEQIDFTSELPSAFYWLNEPDSFNVDNGLHITTTPNTDFWQRTHYGFQVDNGHALLCELSGDFSIETRVRFQYKNRYDQCGLLLRVDAENWIKLCLEYETPQLSMLGSVVTNLGYSDWSTTELDIVPRQLWYRISKTGPDFLLQSSIDGQNWQQLRVTHLLAPFDALHVGLFACSPKDGRFSCTFNHLLIDESAWKAD